MIKCPICDFQNPEGAAFCGQCDSILVPRVSKSREAAPKKGPRFLVARSGEEVLLSDKQEIQVGRAEPGGFVPDVDTTAYGGHALGVSRRHCQIRKVADGFQVEDNNSKFGTFVNGKRLPPATACPLADGDSLKLGELLLTFRSS